MIAVHGKWYDGNTSFQKSAVMKVYDDGAVQVEGNGDGLLLFQQSRLAVDLSDRLANTPRILTFPNGSIFETDDNPAIDTIAEKFFQTHWSQRVHFLESKMRYVLLAGAVVILVMAAMVKYGVPAAADIISRYLPSSVYDLADRQALKALHHLVLKTSQLPPGVEKRVRGNLAKCISGHAAHNIKIVFKKGNKLGPNALALPAGTIVFTDELVEIAEDDEELVAILAHEIGHVVHRHGMRRMVQDSLLSFAIMALTGDAHGVSEIFMGLPVILTELAYSREFERSADSYALDYLVSNDIPPHRFADILLRIDKTSREKAHENGEKWTGYLSTHPPTIKRVEAFLSQN